MSEHGVQIGRRVRELMRNPDMLPDQAFRQAFDEAPPAPTLTDAINADIMKRLTEAAPWFAWSSIDR